MQWRRMASQGLKPFDREARLQAGFALFSLLFHRLKTVADGVSTEADKSDRAVASGPQ